MSRALRLPRALDLRWARGQVWSYCGSNLRTFFNVNLLSVSGDEQLQQLQEELTSLKLTVAEVRRLLRV